MFNILLINLQCWSMLLGIYPHASLIIVTFPTTLINWPRFVSVVVTWGLCHANKDSQSPEKSLKITESFRNIEYNCANTDSRSTKLITLFVVPIPFFKICYSKTLYFFQNFLVSVPWLQRFLVWVVNHGNRSLLTHFMPVVSF